MIDDWKTSIEDKINALSRQVECVRLLGQIENGFRELRTNIAKAHLAKEGEEGYMPEQELRNGGRFAVPEDEGKARSGALTDLSIAVEELDEFIGFLPSHAGFSELVWRLRDLQRTVGEEARGSACRSLNEIALSAHLVSTCVFDMTASARAIVSE